MKRVTFALDDETAQAIRALAARKRRPQSAVVREAVAVYAREEERLTEQERDRRLRILDEFAATADARSAADVDKELGDIRRSRRSGWRSRGE
jgi:predicted DNA-binding protein